MFGTIGRSWQFAKISYGIIWDFKKLLLFPLLSIAAVIAVMGSFLAPLWASGTLETWLAVARDHGHQRGPGGDRAMMYGVLFLFYFACYFVIVFFNSALTACALKTINGEAPTLRYGLAVAGQRLPQILAWALVSAVIGVLLRAVENAHRRAGYFVAVILGSAWTALTFFVVPVLVLEGAGPWTAIKRSTSTLKATWGEAVVGNMSLGVLGFLVMLPVLLACTAMAMMALASQNQPLLIGAIAAGALLMIIASAINSAADVILKALLFNYATGQWVPDHVDSALLDQAFRARE